MVNYHLLKNSIILNFNGKTFTINKSDTKFEDIIKAIKENKLELIPDIVDVEAKMKKSGFDYKNGSVLVKDEPMPEELTDRILEHTKMGISADIFHKFWANLKENPSLQSRKMLYKFLEANGHPLTEDGCFIAYRGVTSDFKDPHTKTFDNSPGSICEMKREDVDDNPANTCSRGLHVAGYDFAKGFDKITVEVKVHPKDVVSVPNDYNGTKMRVCKFEVMKVCEKPITAPVYKEEKSLLDDTFMPETKKAAKKLPNKVKSTPNTHLVKIQGAKTWDRIEAKGFQSAAKDYAKAKSYSGTVFVRKGSTTVKKFKV